MRFSFECRNAIGFKSLRHTIGLKKSRAIFFIQSEVKPKPITTHSHSFSRALRSLDYPRPLRLARVITLAIENRSILRYKGFVICFVKSERGPTIS